MKTLKSKLETYCELHWWNMGKKTLAFKGNLGDLLKKQNITFTKKETKTERVFIFHFKNPYGISFKATGTLHDFTLLAKQAIQMELVRMGDKSELSVTGTWRPTVNVNM